MARPLLFTVASVALLLALLLLWERGDAEHASIPVADRDREAGGGVELATVADARDGATRLEVGGTRPGLVLRWRAEPATAEIEGLTSTLRLCRFWTTDVVHEAQGRIGADGWAEARLDAMPSDWDGDWSVTMQVRSDELRLLTDRYGGWLGIGDWVRGRETYDNVARDVERDALALVDPTRDGTLEFEVPAVVVRPLVAGRVVDASGRGVPDVRMRFATGLAPWRVREAAHILGADGEEPEQGGVLRSATDGTFEVFGSGFSDGFEVEFEGRDGDHARLADVAVGSRDHVVQLGAAVRVSGRLEADAAVRRLVDLAVVSTDDDRARRLFVDPATGAFDVRVRAAGPHDLLWCVGREVLRLPPIRRLDLASGAHVDLGVIRASDSLRLHAVAVVESREETATLERRPDWGAGPAALVLLRSGERLRRDESFWIERCPNVTRSSGGAFVIPATSHLVEDRRRGPSRRGGSSGPDACWPSGDMLVARGNVDWIARSGSGLFDDDLLVGLELEVPTGPARAGSLADDASEQDVEEFIDQVVERRTLESISRIAAVVGDPHAAADPAAFLDERGFDRDHDRVAGALLLASDGAGWRGEITSPEARPMPLDGHLPFQVVRRERAELVGFDVLLPACPDGWRVGVRVLGLDGSDEPIEPGGIAFVPDEGAVGPARIRFAADRTGRFRVLPVAWRADEHPRVWLEAPIQEPEEAARFPFGWEDRAGDPNLAPARVEWPTTLLGRALAVEVAEGAWPVVDAGTFDELVANDAAYRDVVVYP